MVAKVFLVLMTAHSSVGHTNSYGVQAALSYIEFPSLAECEGFRKPIEQDAVKRLQDAGKEMRFWRVSFKVSSECKVIETP